MKKAIEVEYWVVDRDGELTAPDGLTDVSEHTEGEFVEPLFEVKTPPCDSYAELRTIFLDQLEDVLAIADELDKLLVPLGTPIHGESILQRSDERTRIQNEVLGTNFDYTKYCAGTHVHFDKRNVADQLNVLIALDPALALLSSSPYFQGRRIATDARAYLYRKKGYENYPKHGQLWDYVETVAEWETRLEHRFEEFTEAAIEAGVDEESVEEHFSPDDVVWTPIRLRDAMPTVEWRSPDASLPSQVLRLVEEIDSVMEHLHDTTVRIEGDVGEVRDDGITLPEFEATCEYAEAAILEGLESADVAGYLERMGFDVSGYDPITREIDGRDELSPADAREIRRRYGVRLREDVETLLQE